MYYVFVVILQNLAHYLFYHMTFNINFVVLTFLFTESGIFKMFRQCFRKILQILLTD